MKRRGHPAEPQLAIGQAEGALRAACRRHGPGEQAVIGADEYRGSGLHRDAAPGRADPGIDHRHVDGRRQVGQGLGQHGGPAPDVTRRDQVRHVDEAGVRRDPGRYAVTGGDEPVVEPVIGEEAEVAEMSHDR